MSAINVKQTEFSSATMEWTYRYNTTEAHFLSMAPNIQSLFTTNSIQNEKYATFNCQFSDVGDVSLNLKAW